MTTPRAGGPVIEIPTANSNAYRFAQFFGAPSQSTSLFAQPDRPLPALGYSDAHPQYPAARMEWANRAYPPHDKSSNSSVVTGLTNEVRIIAQGICESGNKKGTSIPVRFIPSTV